jgi:hypothetical protein
MGKRTELNSMTQNQMMRLTQMAVVDLNGNVMTANDFRTIVTNIVDVNNDSMKSFKISVLKDVSSS